MTTSKAKALLLEAELVGVANSDCLHPVGAVMVSPDGKIISHGANKVMIGESCKKRGYCSLFQKNCSLGKRPSRAVHAEVDAVLSALEAGQSVVSASIYVSQKPCLNCLKFLIRSGVAEVYFPGKLRDAGGYEYPILTEIDIIPVS